jgi:hypothetical protein
MFNDQSAADAKTTMRFFLNFAHMHHDAKLVHARFNLHKFNAPK